MPDNLTVGAVLEAKDAFSQVCAFLAAKGVVNVQRSKEAMEVLNDDFSALYVRARTEDRERHEKVMGLNRG